MKMSQSVQKICRYLVLGSFLASAAAFIEAAARADHFGNEPGYGYAGGYANQGFFIGERALNTERSYREVEIVAAAPNGTFILKFLDTGAIGSGWTAASLAKLSGCSASEGFCVGEEAINTERSYRKVQVKAIEASGKLVLLFEDTMAVGGEWSRTDLAKLSGCSQGLCVGDRAYNLQRSNRMVTIIAIEADGNFVLRFEDTMAVGGNWSFNDLAPMQGYHSGYPAPAPYPGSSYPAPAPYPAPYPGPSYPPAPVPYPGPAPVPAPPAGMASSFRCTLHGQRSGVDYLATATDLNQARTTVYQRCAGREGPAFCSQFAISCVAVR